MILCIKLLEIFHIVMFLIGSLLCFLPCKYAVSLFPELVKKIPEHPINVVVTMKQAHEVQCLKYYYECFEVLKCRFYLFFFFSPAYWHYGIPIKFPESWGRQKNRLSWSFAYPRLGDEASAGPMLVHISLSTPFADFIGWRVLHDSKASIIYPAYTFNSHYQ